MRHIRDLNAVLGSSKLNHSWRRCGAVRAEHYGGLIERQCRFKFWSTRGASRGSEFGTGATFDIYVEVSARVCVIERMSVNFQQVADIAEDEPSRTRIDSFEGKSGWNSKDLGFIRVVGQ